MVKSFEKCKKNFFSSIEVLQINESNRINRMDVIVLKDNNGIKSCVVALARLRHIHGWNECRILVLVLWKCKQIVRWSITFNYVVPLLGCEFTMMICLLNRRLFLFRLLTMRSIWSALQEETKQIEHIFWWQNNDSRQRHSVTRIKSMQREQYSFWSVFV